MSRKVITVLAASVSTLATGAVGAASATAATHVKHQGARPAWATSARDAGHANGNGRVDVRVWLGYRNPDQAKALAASVGDPSSASYGHYLTPAEFDARFAPTASQVSKVSSWLRSSGLDVSAVGSDNRYVAATGTVRQAEKAFGARLDNFNIGGHLLRAPSGDLSLPSAVAATVAGVTGLDTGDHRARPTNLMPDGYRNAQPLSSYYGEKTDDVAYSETGYDVPALPSYPGAGVLPYADQGYTPPQLRAAYGLSNSATAGAGTTIAIVDAYAATTMLADAQQYDRNHDGLNPLTSSTYTETVPSSFDKQGPCDASGWPGEETLDVESAHAIAPGANIHYFGAVDCYDPALLDALSAAIDSDADVISNSWSGYEADETADLTTAYQQEFLKAAATGKAVLFSSGDDGDELAATGTKQVDYPSSDPGVIGVGGTSVALGQGGALLGQTGWGTYKSTYTASSGWSTAKWLYGSGGGCSVLFSAPSWQSVNTGCGNHRAVPDISMDGDPTTGMLVGETQQFNGTVTYDEYRIGGTSLSSPLFAGVLARVDAVSSTKINGPAALYRVKTGITDVLAQGSQGTMPDAANVRVDFNDSIDAAKGIAISARTFGHDSSLSLGRGYDQTTGLGTPNGGFVSGLASALAK